MAKTQSFNCRMLSNIPFSFLVSHFLPIHYKCIGILLHLITLSGTRTLGRITLDKGLAHCRDLYLTRHDTRKRHTSMPLAGFEPTIPESELPQTHALACTATRNGLYYHQVLIINSRPLTLNVTLLYSSPICQNWQWGPHSLPFNQCRNFFPRIMQAVNHLPTCSF